MMTSSRPSPAGGSFANRRGHSNKLSISDPSHHVTEAIGTLYDDEHDDDLQDGPQRHSLARPLSFLSSPYSEEIHRAVPSSENARPSLERSTSDSTGLLSPGSANNPPLKKAQTFPARVPSHLDNPSPGSPLSPTMTLKDVQSDPSTSQFPLMNMNNPNDIAQELSNLQALRRMSMDVGNNNDPDMLPFSGLSLMAMPSIAPSGDDDEADPSRLLWVPARVHPELAPTEFRTFLENRVQSIKRRSSTTESLLSVDEGPGRSNSIGLRRKKSMLSRQIDPSGGGASAGYIDGAERLERKRSQTGRGGASDLTLDELVRNPSRVVQKLTREANISELGPETNLEDMPILPIAPGAGLRRSTRTQYRKGGSLRGDKLPFSKRIATRQAEAESGEPKVPPLEAPPGYGLNRTQSEPVTENYSRPTRALRRQQNLPQESPQANTDQEQQAPADASKAAQNRSYHIDGSATVPQIVETPPPQEEPTVDPIQHQPPRYPQRSSSQKASTQMLHTQPDPRLQQQEQQPFPDEPPAKSSKRQARAAQAAPPPQSHQTPPAKKPARGAADMPPSTSPDGRANRTDSLTFIPTYSGDDRKQEKRGKKDKDDESSTTTSSSKSGWKWFKGGSGADDKKKKDEEKKSKAKAFVEKAQDNVRLDVIQTSIENAVSSRKSQTSERDGGVADNGSISKSHHHEEKRKESGHRKSDSKKEKDGNIFSSFFGGSKRKSDKDGHGGSGSGSSKKGSGHSRKVSEEPPYRPLKPDVDYHWTRFPLLEERAIYRMAHIKLANPRRSLHSQVLLSNFMYNYLAIVQAMHPQMQIPVSPQQRRLEEERRRKEQEEQQRQEEQYLAEQQQMQAAQESQDCIDRYTFDYHRDGNQAQYGEAHAADESVDYMDDTQIYDYDGHGDHGDARGQGNGYELQRQGGKDYYSYGQQRHDDDGGRRDGRDDMW